MIFLDFIIKRPFWGKMAGKFPSDLHKNKIFRIIIVILLASDHPFPVKC